jgi:zinc protease
VQAEYTKESVHEIVKELEDIAGRRPPDEAELAYVKGSMLKGIPEDFETVGDVSRRLYEIAKYELPLDTWEKRVRAIEGTTVDDMVRLGGEYVKPDELLIVVVGDASKIEPGLEELAVGEVSVLDEGSRRSTQAESTEAGKRSGAAR